MEEREKFACYPSRGPAYLGPSFSIVFNRLNGLHLRIPAVNKHPYLRAQSFSLSCLLPRLIPLLRFIFCPKNLSSALPLRRKVYATRFPYVVHCARNRNSFKSMDKFPYYNLKSCHDKNFHFLTFTTTRFFRSK